MTELTGKVAIVTGAARGIGRSIAMTLAQAGAVVAVLDKQLEKFDGQAYYRLKRRVSGADEAVPTAQAIVDAGGQAAAFAVDVADADAVAVACAQVIDALGPVDILINNAGVVNNIATIARMAPQDWAHELQVNLSGAFHCTQVLAPQMAARGWGRVVNIASVAARQPGLGQPAYTASKAGLAAFTQSIAQEFGPKGITANAILPGLIGTPLVRSMPEHIREKTIERVPVQRLGEPQDIANLARFLVSDAASFITGTAIPCDGGLLGAPLGGLS